MIDGNRGTSPDSGHDGVGSRETARWWTALAAVTVLLTGVAGCGGGGEGDHRRVEGASFPAVQRRAGTYRVPSPLPRGRPGQIVAVSPEVRDPAVPDAGRRVMLYRSTDVTGHDIVVSGLLVVPRRPPPSGGWPVVSWGHGTTGVADRCAPSEHPNLFYDEYAQMLGWFIQAGYAVAATDYPGLGTPGVHSYLVGVDEGNAMVDIVTAAHQLTPHLARRWFAVGHSQGGQAALFATRSSGRSRANDLAGTVAIAPASTLDAILPAVIHGGDLNDQAYAVAALAGLATVDPHLDVPSLLGPRGRTRLPLLLESACLDQVDAAFRQVPVSELFHISAVQEAQLNGALARVGNPDRAATVGPVLVVQGAEDGDVPAGITSAMVSRLRAARSDVTERVYPGLGHDSVLGPSHCDVLNWLASQGGAPRAPCTPQPTAPS